MPPHPETLPTARGATRPARLPWLALLALAAAGFVTILTEALPAGLLPPIGADLGVSESLAGQLVTVYATGSLLAAIPLTAATQGMRRRPLLLAAIAGFAIANTVTTVSGSYALTLVARLLAGVSAGLLWALLAGHAARMVPAHLRGRAIAIAMVGTPLALSLGIPAGTFLGTVIGWRVCFGIMSVLAVVLMVWVRLTVPDFPGQKRDSRHTLGQVVMMRGIRPVLFVVLAFVLAHNVLYTYIAPFLAGVGMAGRTDVVLLVFGTTSLAGIWAIGVLIDRHLRALTLGSTVLFGLAAVALGAATGANDAAIVYGAVAAWGFAFGGAATLFQTALARAGGEAADVAQSMLVTAWNVAIAGGGLVGGLLLDGPGVRAFPPALLALLVPTIVVICITGGKPKTRGAG
ncbi:MAG TPA: MFS transporter [Duganella sp.]|nr:MFS transporter [Duganella sp.]